MAAEPETKEQTARLGETQTFLREMISLLQPDVRTRGPGRPQVLPSLCLWAGLLVCVLNGFSSQSALWRLISLQGLWDYPRFAVTDQAVRNRLASAGEAMQRLFAQITAVLVERLAPYAQPLAPWAASVVALDCTTLDPVLRKLPVLREVPRGSDALLPGKLAGLFDLRLQVWRKIAFTDEARENEKVSARAMVSELPRGSLVLADLGYFGFAWFDDLTAAGHHWISRQRKKTSVEVRHVFFESAHVTDALVWLGKYRADQARYPVRLVRIRVGREEWEYLTNLLDPKLLPVAEIARLYARRWDIEMAIKLVKRELGLHLLWSAKTEVILAQVWAVLCIAQILQALRQEVAGRAGVDAFDVSMSLLLSCWSGGLPGRSDSAVFRPRDQLVVHVDAESGLHRLEPHALGDARWERDVVRPVEPCLLSVEAR
ncbi:MAG TPA: IS4 family transposase [Longimicrobiaceae bacterium]|jgi:hypothetical protein|nr:IS4 family transposase [Longimicrobiaceae bacterium]